MDKALKMAWLLELMWLTITGVMLLVWYLLLDGKVNRWIHLFFTYNILIALVYAWWVVQVHQSPVVRSFWGKLPFILGNIPLFFWLMNKADFFTKLFDAMYYIPVGETEAYISSKVELEGVLFIKNSGVFWSVAAMVMTILLIIRFVFAIFKYKQIPIGPSHH